MHIRNCFNSFIGRKAVETASVLLRFAPAEAGFLLKHVYTLLWIHMNIHGFHPLLRELEIKRTFAREEEFKR
jgi:hypothetical protein